MKIINLNQAKISFTAGKVSVYSDFDGTYFPESQFALQDIKPERVNELNEHFKNFNRFFENTKDDIDFKITTGRTFGEYENMADIIKSKGINMPYSKSFICKNGSDEFVRTSDFGLYSKEFPYSYDMVNNEKTDGIKRLTNWSENIQIKLKNILKNFDFEIIEHDSEHSVKDHGNKSLFSRIAYDNFELYDGIAPKSDWKVGLRRDGLLKLSISFPYDMLHSTDRKKVYNDIKSSFEEFLKSADVKFESEEFIDKAGGNRPTLEYYPKVENGALTKLYDTKQALKRAVLDNDLVITAGDGLNDYDMLNPLNYLEGDKDLSNPQTIAKLKKLPFVGIVIKSDEPKLKELYKKFSEFGKIIEVEKGHLQEGIIAAIKEYAQNAKEFTQNMSDNLKDELGILTDTVSKPIETTKNVQKTNTKLYAILGLLTAGLSGIVLALQNHKSDEVQK